MNLRIKITGLFPFHLLEYFHFLEVFSYADTKMNFRYERDYADMNEKKDRTELNRKVIAILKSHIAQKV